MGVTITISGELAPCRESDVKVIEDKRPPIQVKINYMHHKMGR